MLQKWDNKAIEAHETIYCTAVIYNEQHRRNGPISVKQAYIEAQLILDNYDTKGISELWPYCRPTQWPRIKIK